MAKEIIYTDLDLDFDAHPITGNLMILENEDAIKQSIRTLINTVYYDKPFHPEIGCQVKGLLFLPVTEATIETIRTVIGDMLEDNEPRIQVLDIIVAVDDSETGYNIVTYYTMINTTEALKVETYLQRVR